MNLAIGNRYAMTIKQAWSVFVVDDGMKLFAGKGKIQMQAQDDEIEALARKDVTLASIAGDIDLAAAKSIRITAGGGCQILIENGQISFKAPKGVNIHGSVKNFMGPASVTPELPRLPQAPLNPDPEKPLYSQQFDLSHVAYDEDSLSYLSKNKPYSVYDKQGNFIGSGTLNENGLTDRIFTNESQDLVVIADEGAWNIEEHIEAHDAGNDDADDGNGALA